MLVRLSWAGLVVALAQLGSLGMGCSGDRDPPTLDRLRQPSGLSMSPDGQWLFVTGGNWDQLEEGGTLMVLDLAAVAAALEQPGSQRCDADEAGTLLCPANAFVRPEHTLILGDAIGDVVTDPLGGEASRWRLLMVQRIPSSIVWVDARQTLDGLELECGQSDARSCDSAHQLRQAADDPAKTLPDDASRIILDEQGFRFAYVPHLVGGELSLLDLDGEFGPEVSAVTPEFFQPAIFEGLDARGGFSVAGRPCDPTDAHMATRDCTRPLLYATHRFWPGTRRFTVAPGLEVVLPGKDIELAAIGTETVSSLPLMGDLAFEDPDSYDMLVVQTTPGSLARVDTSVDDEGEFRDLVQATVPLCNNPNVLAVHRPSEGEKLALVTCFGDARVVVVGLGSFRILKSIPVGSGPNEIELDARRSLAYVANTRSHSISVLDLDPRRPSYLTESMRIGE